MKAKIKTILLTFIATTVFWCLFIGSILWWAGEKSGMNFMEDARRRGFVVMMSARNAESQPVTFTVAELRTNTATSDDPQVVLLERQLPPAGEFWIGIKKVKAEKKP